MTLDEILRKHTSDLNDYLYSQEQKYHALYKKIHKFITDSNVAKLFPDRLNIDALYDLQELRKYLNLPELTVRKKVGAQYCVYEDSGTLTESIQRIYPLVDSIQILLNYRPWCGTANPAGAQNTYDTVKSIPDPDKKILLISHYWETEAEQRNFGKDLFEKMGIPWTMIIDDDEMYNREELKNAIDALQNTEHQALLVHQQIYWKTKQYCIQNITYAMPTFVVSNLERCHFHYCRNIKVVGTWTNLDPDIILNHHLSYVRTDDKLLRKIQTFSHADEERRDGKDQKQIWQDWYENVWLKWEPEMTGLHPNPNEKYSWFKAVDASTAKYKLQPLESVTTKTKVDVIIPSLSKPEYHQMIKDCITSLRESETNVKFNCILIESYQQTFDLGQDVTIKYDQPKFNYHHAINQGLDVLTSDWVVMANNDLIFSKGWFTEILKIKTQHPHYQSFSPWEPSFCMDGDSQEYYEGYRVGQNITGWCIVCNKEIFRNVTLSEEIDYWFSDNNYADELERNGIRHALVKNSVVKHLCQQTTLRLPNWREMTVDQTAKYEKIKYKKDNQKEV